MDGPSDQLFTRPRLPRYKNRGVAARYFPYLFHDGPQDGALANDFAKTEFTIDLFLQIDFFFRELFFCDSELLHELLEFCFRALALGDVPHDRSDPIDSRLSFDWQVRL